MTHQRCSKPGWVVLFTGFILGVLAHHNPCWGQQFNDQELEFFEAKVRPLLVERCFECHGSDAEENEGGLSLASRSAILEGGDSGPAIDLEDLDESLLLDAINYGDLFQMPPESKMSDAEIEILKKWISMRAPWPKEDVVERSRSSEFDLVSRRQAHWCWQPVRKPEVPSVNNSNWPRDDLDRFILAQLEQSGLTPAAPASRSIWIRRVYFDLLGLPPTVQQVREFEADTDPDAFEKVVDQVLTSPRFGERWARHWMDLIRYAETCGHEFDYPIPNAYQYRDYLIRAFNADVPYNEFIIEHVAGDLLKDPRRNPDNQINESVLATGFWYLGEATHGPVDVKGNEAGHIDNQIDIFGKSFLGLTVACARCHEHKFDAITTEDYYALSGFLQSSRRQDVMLDPDARIKQAYQQARLATGSADATLNAFVDATTEDFRNHRNDFADYLEAAVLYLRSTPGWHVSDWNMIEAESLKTISKDSGNVRVQRIADNPNAKWSGENQLWWMDGKIGDSIEVEINVVDSGNYMLVGDFTQAHDYGIVQISLDGEKLGQPIDLYAKSVSKTGERSFGARQLAAGKHRIRMTLTGKNPQAAPRHMVGVDYFRLDPQQSAAVGEAKQQQLKSLASQFNLDAQRLDRWVQAIRDDSTKQIGHLLYPLRQAAKSNASLDGPAGEEFFQELHLRLVREKSAADQWLESSTLLADFTEDDPPGWRRTGFAFGTESEMPDPQLTWSYDYLHPESPLAIARRPRSSRFGAKQFGVLRSPTFEITHPSIHYRMKGDNVRVRLIIDGYTLDLNNPLLFSGISFTFSSPDRFVWYTQAGDLKNYLGHRAYIEIIDHGNGFASVDQIRMSQSPQVPEIPSTAACLSCAPMALGAAEKPAEHLDLGVVARRLSAISQAVLTGNQVPGQSEFATLTPRQQSIAQRQLLNTLYRYRLTSSSDGQDSLYEKLRQASARIAEIDKHNRHPKLAVGMTDGSAENEFVFIRGNHKNLGPQIARRPLAALLNGDPWDLSSEPGSGRMQLAQHVASEENPLTSRVIVNRLWHHLTGRGIVASVDNFGVLGQTPTHPKLLDFLAAEFVEDGWRLKRMIRRIVLSQTYRMSSQLDATAAELDPDNTLMHRARIRRLQGEAIRDAMLAISGELDETMYGPSVAIHLTPFMQGRGRPGKSGPLDGDARRSIYIEVRRNFLSPMMLAFDTPIPFNSIGRRNVSNVPAQALILMNDPFVVDQAKKWAQRLIDEKPDVTQRIVLMFESALGRTPDPDELVQATEFLETQAKELGLTPADVATHVTLWSDLCHVIFNTKEFIYLK